MTDHAVDASPVVRKALQDMATRDQFALAYAQAAMGRPRDDLWPMVAEEAYKFADAMMKARAK